MRSQRAELREKPEGKEKRTLLGAGRSTAQHTAHADVSAAQPVRAVLCMAESWRKVLPAGLRPGGRPVNESVGLDTDPVWLNINYPKGTQTLQVAQGRHSTTGPLGGDWRAQLVEEAARSRAEHNRVLRAIDARQFRTSVRRRSSRDPQLRNAVRRLRERVRDIDRARSTEPVAAASAEAAGAQPPPSSGRRCSSVTGSGDDDWRKYVTTEVITQTANGPWDHVGLPDPNPGPRCHSEAVGATARIAERAAEIVRNPPNESKINNKLHFGGTETGPTDYRANFQHGRPFGGLTYSQEYLKLANLLPDSGRSARAREMEERRLSRTLQKQRTVQVRGLYRNTEVPAPEPLLSPEYSARRGPLSLSQASYTIDQFPPHMRAIPNAERLSLTHADVHRGVNRNLLACRR
eukprot:COSAG01_NODE_426_length_17219_cov_9.275637_2_plen_406_part_00